MTAAAAGATAVVINLAAARAARAARDADRAANYEHCVEIAQPMAKRPSFGAPAAPPAAPAPQLRWRESKAGNWWVTDPRTGIHFVVFENRRGWSGRATPPQGEGFYVNMPSGIGSEEEARTWAEQWLAEVAARQLSKPHAG